MGGGEGGVREGKGGGEREIDTERERNLEI